MIKTLIYQIDKFSIYFEKIISNVLRLSHCIFMAEEKKVKSKLVENEENTLTHLAGLLKSQPKGEEGVLLTGMRTFSTSATRRVSSGL